jgi:hypothetical protein
MEMILVDVKSPFVDMRYSFVEVSEAIADVS